MDLINVFSCASDRTRDNGPKWKDRWFPLNIRKCFWVVRVTENWHMLPRGVEIFRI